MDAVSLRDVTFRFFPEGKRNILDHVDFTLPEGGITVLTGESGCGKSTLAAVMAGLYPENGGALLSGSISLFGRPLAEMNHQERAGYLTMMFQNPDLQFCMNTLRKELLFCMENICVPQEEMEPRLQKAAQALRIPHLLDRKLETLSGGEKQKAALCCLLALDSRVFVLDEAFANIDTDTAKGIITFLRTLADGGKTVLAIDHRKELWQEAADRFIHFGPQGEENPLSRYPRRQSDTAAVSLRNFSISQGQRSLLKNADADFPKGCISAILGKSGSGKTTAFLSILKQHPYAGTVLINGQDLKTIRERALFGEVGIVFQNPGNQFITQNVQQEVEASLRLWNKDEDVQLLLENYGLWLQRKYSPYMLSQGQQRRLAVVSILAGGQKILLLDEPTYGQDSHSTAVIMEQLRRKTEKEGLTVILTTHDEALAAAWADKIFRLEGGALHEA